MNHKMIQDFLCQPGKELYMNKEYCFKKVQKNVETGRFVSQGLSF